MADPTWDETTPAAVPSADVPKWEETAPVGTDSPATSPVTAATTGLMNLHGWGPAIGAAGKTAMDAVTGGTSLDDLVDEYKRNRDQLKSEFAKAAAAHPTIAGAGHLAGDVAALGVAGPAAMTSRGMAATGALMGAGPSDINQASDILPAAKSAAMGAGMNLAAGTAANAAAPYIGKAAGWVGDKLSPIAEKISDVLGGKAEDLAEAATGATGAQARNFNPGTGRFLLDNGVVNFGSSAKDVAENAQGLMDQSGENISDILNNKLQGTTVDRNTVLKYIQDKIDSLSGNEGENDLVAALEKKKADIAGEIKPGLTEETADSSIPISQSEKIRRSFDKNSKWNSNTDSSVVAANKTAANGYREAGVDAATAADPEIGAQFQAAKKTYNMLNPVQEAAEKRAATLNQSPLGGLKDVASAGIGGGVAGVPGAIASAVGNRLISPRLASMGAVTADQISKVVASSPAAFGRFASTLTNAASRGAASLHATDYLLQQTNEDYRQQRNKVFNPDPDESTPVPGDL